MSSGNKSRGKNVNLKVDKSVSIVDIITVLNANDDRRVCALEIDGRSFALAQLKDLQLYHESDYNKLLNVMHLVSGYHEVFGKHVKQGKGRYKGIYEMRGGQARLFYFIDSSGKAIVVCTNLYWKAKPSPKEQNQAFNLCLELRNLYSKYNKIETP